MTSFWPTARGIEIWYPRVLGVGSAALVVSLGPVISSLSKPSGQINLGQVYRAIFNVSGVITGFSYAIYGIVMTFPTPFIKRLRGTQVLRDYRSYLKSTILSGFFVLIGSIYPLAVELQPTAKLSPANTNRPNS